MWLTIYDSDIDSCIDTFYIFISLPLLIAIIFNDTIFSSFHNENIGLTSEFLKVWWEITIRETKVFLEINICFRKSCEYLFKVMSVLDLFQ